MLLSKGDKEMTLHSTMFLLIPGTQGGLRIHLRPLHSTMFLLIPIGQVAGSFARIFTFHNVSINTASVATLYLYTLSLHSTMFLLIRSGRGI